MIRWNNTNMLTFEKEYYVAWRFASFAFNGFLFYFPDDVHDRYDIQIFRAIIYIFISQIT
jgi:hypothetical protein